MVAYQMIYTACGKDKSGAFSVWAKSANVTKAECDEIVKLMSYRKPQNAPYEPTEEEIRTLFPKKYGYFILSSGRICLAQTSYIGKVYSDLDARNGNFIIHAYIADELSGVNPFGIFNSGIFKTCLSYREWHDSEAPADLPPVELSIKPNMDEAAIRNDVLGARKKEVASFLQAVIDAAASGTSVTFNDTEEKQMQLYSLLGVMLPAVLFKKTTFGNQYSTQLDYAMSGSNMHPLLLRNIFSGMINTAFNYQEQLNAGQAVFYFEKGICSDIAPKRYVTDIIQTLESGNSLFAMSKKIDAVNKIMSETDCDIDKAIAIYYITQIKLDWFNGADEYLQAVELALKQHYIEEQAVAARLYNDIILTGKWGQGSKILPLIQFAYAHNDKNVKASIMEQYFNNLQSYGVDLASNPRAVLAQVKGTAPFPWDDFAVSLAENPKWEAYMGKNASVSCLYFIFDAAVCALTKNLKTANNQYVYGLLVKILKGSVSRRSLDEIQLYLGLAKSIGDASFIWLIEAMLDEYLTQTIKDEATLDFIFRFVCTIDHEQEKVKLIGKLISANMQSAFFMQMYIRYSKEYQSLFSKVENTYKSDAFFRDFLFRKDAHVFKTATKVSFKSLDDYFNKYYRAGYDSGVYLEKIKMYLSTLSGKDRITESLKLYDQLKSLEDSFADVIKIIDYLNQGIFALPMDELLSRAPLCLQTLDEINGRLQRAKVKAPDNYLIMRTVLLFRGKLGSEACVNGIQQNTLYGMLNDIQLKRYLSDYFGEALRFYCENKKKGAQAGTLLRAVFERPLQCAGSSIEIITVPLEKLGSREYYEIMADIFSYAFNANDKFAAALNAFAKRYVDTMNRGDYKKLFKKIVEIMPESDVPAVQKYIDQYLEAHMSFFKKLFSKKK